MYAIVIIIECFIIMRLYLLPKNDATNDAMKNLIDLDIAVIIMKIKILKLFFTARFIHTFREIKEKD